MKTVRAIHLLGASIGISLMFTMQSRMAQVHQTALASNISQYNDRFLAWADGVKSLIPGQAAIYGLAHKAVVVQAVLLSFLDCFRWLAYTAIIAAPFVFFFKGTRHIKSQAEMSVSEL